VLAFDWLDYNVWHFLLGRAIMFIFLLAVSYITLRVARLNKIVYLVVHPIVTFIFGSLIVILLFSAGWVVPINVAKNIKPMFCELIMLVGMIAGGLVVARIYLIDDENRNYRAWIYLLAIFCGIMTYLTEPNYVRGVVLSMTLVNWFFPVPLMYLGYLGIKFRIRYLQKRRISRLKEKGLEG